MPTTDLTPGTITTLGALRPGDVGAFIPESEWFVVQEAWPSGKVVVLHDDDHGAAPYLPTRPVRYLGRGRIEPARIVMEGEMETPIEQTVRRVLAVAVADGIATCARDPMTMTTGELVGPANVLSAAMGEQQRRIAELEEQVRALREFIRECATNFDCDRDAHRYQTFCRQCEARAALAATAPKDVTHAK